MRDPRVLHVFAQKRLGPLRSERRTIARSADIASGAPLISWTAQNKSFANRCERAGALYSGCRSGKSAALHIGQAASFWLNEAVGQGMLRGATPPPKMLID